MCFLYFPEALCLLIVYFSFVCMPHAVCLMNTGFADTATDIIYANVYPCFFAHNKDFHTVFSNYLLFLNSFLNVIFIRMILILFTPLVMKWELLIIIKRINKGYGGTNCLHFIHKFSPYLHFIPFTTEVI